LVQAMPPEQGFTYRLKQADAALKIAYTTLTRTTAFSYKNSPYTYAAANTFQITADGEPLLPSFLNKIKDEGGGVLLLEVTRSSTQPLVLTVEKAGKKRFETSLPLSLGQDVVLLLHGMNSNVNTWDPFVLQGFSNLPPSLS